MYRIFITVKDTADRKIIISLESLLLWFFLPGSRGFGYS